MEQNTLVGDGETGENLDEADGDFANEEAVAREDLHARALVAAIAHSVPPTLLEHHQLPRVPHLSVVPTCSIASNSDHVAVAVSGSLLIHRSLFQAEPSPRLALAVVHYNVNSTVELRRIDVEQRVHGAPAWPKVYLNSPSTENTCTRWLCVSATAMSSSRPRQKP